MNRKGFTLVELLAMLVVLGILMAVAVPNITGILSQSKTNMLKDDVSKMVDSAKVKISTDETIKKPAEGKCIVFTLNSLNKNDDFKEGPNGGEYDLYNSFVIVKRNNQVYEYYATLYEFTEGKLYGVQNVKYTDFEKDSNSKIKVYDKTDYNSNLTKATTTTAQASSNENISNMCSGKLSNFYN